MSKTDVQPNYGCSGSVDEQCDYSTATVAETSISL